MKSPCPCDYRDLSIHPQPWHTMAPPFCAWLARQPRPGNKPLTGPGGLTMQPCYGHLMAYVYNIYNIYIYIYHKCQNDGVRC